ncbi:palmitoyltransferase pfa3 [Histoplasma capsulatum H143]|uniref:Palmitoyltransferase pfa3 n=2 Tax=Ajellomyces capsulatus TaxID=5037 RepID=C6HBV6_AJECH|nr:palmitoyltransferase pfa3 [Histoplasma capsulatum H143]
MQPTKSRWIGPATSVLGIILYILLNSSYTIAVFTDPGSPLTGPRTNSRGNGHMYSSLPTTETSGYTNLTVSSAGGKRYCKKFSATWVWTEILNDTRYIESFGPVANVLLAVIAGIMGLVLSAFTGWHINLAARGSTTIECLEKTRYLAPIRKSFDRQRQIRASPVNGQIDHRLSHTLHSYGHQFLDAHANAIPGVTRAEEGEERSSPTIAPRQFHPDHVPTTYAQHQHLSPAQQSLYHSYDEFEHARERARYDEYLDEQDGEKLPHAFDLGWRRNLIHLFGENPLLWFLPICNTTGDGWHWEASSEWLETKQRIENRRMQRWRGHQPLDQLHPPTAPQPPRSETWQSSGDTSAGGYSDVSRRPTNNEDFDDRGTHVQRPDTGLSMKTLRPMSPRPGAGEVVSEDDSTPPSQPSGRTRSEGQDEWDNWE